MEPRRLQVGIDFSKTKLDICLLSPEGEVLQRATLPNNLPGYARLRDLVLAWGAAGEFTGVDLGGEATGPYWMPLFWQAQQDPTWAAHDLQLYLLNPRQVHWFRKSYAAAEKTDRQDAYYIAERLRTQRQKQPWGWTPEALRLRFYTRARFRLAQHRTRVKNIFWALMFLWCNGYGAQNPFADGLGACGRALVAEYPDWQVLVAPSPEDLSVQLAAWGRQRQAAPVAQARQLQRLIQESIPLPEALREVLHNLLRLQVEQLAFVEQQIRQVERLIRQEVREHHPEVQCLLSIPGIGPVLAAGIAAEIGPLARFFAGEKNGRRKNLRDVEGAVAKYAGLWWPRRESGAFRAEERRLAKQGNRFLRYYLVEAADRLRQHLPEYQAYYQRKWAESQKHRHKRALVLTARKSVGLFVGLLHRQEPYRSPEERQSA